MSQALSSRRRTTGTAAATDTRPTLLFFFSSTSGASRRADGFLAQVLQRRANHATFRLVRVDADEHPDLVERLQISEVPALLVVVEGRVRARIGRPSGCSEISRLLSPWLR
jgi:thioredoxin-like negative regulator of GroEL